MKLIEIIELIEIYTKLVVVNCLPVMWDLLDLESLIPGQGTSRRGTAIHSNILAWSNHGQMGLGTQSCKESATTEALAPELMEVVKRYFW